MKKTVLIIMMALVGLAAESRTTYIVWQSLPPTGSQEWVKSKYYIWEGTYTQTNVDDALQLTPTGKGWIGGGYESETPFDNRVLTDGYELVFDIRTTDSGELSVMLTSAKPEASQSVKLNFERNGEWQTVRLNIREKFPKVFKVWAQGGKGYVFSLVGGAAGNAEVSLRNIRYEKSF